MTISVAAGKPMRIAMGDAPTSISPQALQLRLTHALQENPSTRLVLRADWRVSYGDIKEVLQAAERAGFQRLGLVAERSDPRGVSNAPE